MKTTKMSLYLSIACTAFIMICAYTCGRYGFSILPIIGLVVSLIGKGVCIIGLLQGYSEILESECE